jgi:N-acetylmuramate 1-kinase
MSDPDVFGLIRGFANDRLAPPPATAAPRQRAMTAFLEASGWDGVVPAPLAADASFRSYYRLRRGPDTTIVPGTAIIMDAPPPHEDVGPYVAVAAMLRGLGLSAPEVMAEDRAEGFLLIEDFGDDTYTRLLSRGADERTLYALAIDALAALQQAVAKGGGAPDLPPYDTARLLAETGLFVDWYMPAVLGAPITAALREEYQALWRAVLPLATHPFAPTLVLRDFHIDNLMLLPGRCGIRRCGLLDFQDAVCGPPGYDLVSLIEDARRDVPEDLRRELTLRYLAAFPALDRAAFARSAAILAAQRNCKILGIFTRLSKRDGKPGYLVHVPRLWRLLEADLREPALGDIARWFDRHLPPAARRKPDLGAAA